MAGAMKILHVVAGLPRSGGGLAELVPQFARGASEAGHTVVIATVASMDDRLSDAAGEALGAGIRVVRFAPSWPRFLFFSWRMLWGLRFWVKQAEIIHVHSNWTFPVWWACFWAMWQKKPFVMSPQGTFDPVRLEHSAWKKNLVGWLDRFFLRRASVVHATSEMECGWIERFVSHKGKKRAKIAVVPNGVNIEKTMFIESQHVTGLVASRERVVLYLGRNHPLKGLDLLEKAWKKVKRDGWRLELIGEGLPGGLIAGDEKWHAIKIADVFVLPTRSEGFPLSVLEALAVGVPVITTKGAPWAELVSERCGWWIDVGVEPLAEALREAMSLTDEERRVMGENGRRLVGRKYQWKMVAKQMVELYETVVK